MFAPASSVFSFDPRFLLEHPYADTLQNAWSSTSSSQPLQLMDKISPYHK